MLKRSKKSCKSISINTNNTTMMKVFILNNDYFLQFCRYWLDYCLVDQVSFVAFLAFSRVFSYFVGFVGFGAIWCYVA